MDRAVNQGPWLQERVAGGGVKGFGAGAVVGGRKMIFLKDTLWGGGAYKGSGGGVQGLWFRGGRW